MATRDFRSQQIREELISREEAIKMSSSDNEIDIDSLKEFSELIGINFEEMITKINSIPKLY